MLQKFSKTISLKLIIKLFKLKHWHTLLKLYKKWLLSSSRLEWTLLRFLKALTNLKIHFITWLLDNRTKKMKLKKILHQITLKLLESNLTKINTIITITLAILIITKIARSTTYLIIIKICQILIYLTKIMSLNKTLIENLTHPLISREKMLRPTLLATLINLTRLKKKIHLKKKIALEIFKITHL